MIKLIALDMDGTLLDGDKKVTERAFNAIQEAKEKGVKVVLSTGRPIEGVERFLKDLNLRSDEDYVITYNGSLVQAVRTKEAICDKALTGKDLKEIYKISQELNVNIHAFIKGIGLTTPKISKYTEVEADINKIDIHIMDFNEVDDNEIVVKIMLIDEEEVLDKALEKLPKDIYEKYHCAKSMPFFFEILNRDANKGEALRLLAEHLNLQVDEIMAVGDESNDIEMVKFAGLGVAMENATEKVKEVSNYITAKNTDEGVAKAIEKFVL